MDNVNEQEETSNNITEEVHFKRRKPWVAVVLSILCIGLGHVYDGELKKGIVVLIIINSVDLLFLVSLAFINNFLIIFIIFGFLLIINIYLRIVDPVKIARKKGDSYELKSYNRWFVYAGFYLCIFLITAYFYDPIIRSTLISTWSTPTSNMENTILISDRMIMNMTTYGIHKPFSDEYISFYKEPKVNDVVAFIFPGNRDIINPPEKVYYLKRLVAQWGDTILIVRKRLYVNGKPFFESSNVKFISRIIGKDYPNPNIFPKGSNWNEDNYGPLRIPQKGDTIQLSSINLDAWKIFIMREGHDVQLKNEGTIFIDNNQTDKYIVEKNYYFAMGDNRDNSLDSRYWGFIPEDKIIGKVKLIYWSSDPNIPFLRISDFINSIRWNRIGTEVY